MSKQRKTINEIIDQDLKAIYPAYHRWLIQYQRNHPEIQIGNGGLAGRICREHTDRIWEILQIRKQEIQSDHTFSDALLRLSYYGKDVDFWEANTLDRSTFSLDLADESDLVRLKQARSIQLCDKLCEAVSKTKPLSDQLTTLKNINRNSRYDVLKRSRGVWNTFRNTMLSAACFIGVGLVFGAAKWLTTGSFYFRSESGAHRAQVSKALCTPFLGAKNLGRLKEKLTTHSAAAA